MNFAVCQQFTRKESRQIGFKFLFLDMRMQY